MRSCTCDQQYIMLCLFQQDNTEPLSLYLCFHSFLQLLGVLGDGLQCRLLSSDGLQCRLSRAGQRVLQTGRQCCKPETRTMRDWEIQIDPVVKIQLFLLTLNSPNENRLNLWKWPPVLHTSYVFLWSTWMDPFIWIWHDGPEEHREHICQTDPTTSFHVVRESLKVV